MKLYLLSRQGRDNRPVALRIIEEFEQRGGDQLVVAWHGEDSFFRQLREKDAFLFFWFGDVSGNVRVDRRLEVRSPPVGEHVLDLPSDILRLLGLSEHLGH